jgi:hypothetical protein
LLLELDEVPGTCSIELNGQPLIAASPQQSHYEIPLENLSEKNLLILKVNVPAREATPPSADPPWGHVCLLIRAANDPPQP